METIIVLPYDWITEDKVDHIEIRAWGFDMDDNSVLIRINDYKTFITLTLPPISNGIPISWCETKAQDLYNNICKITKQNQPNDYQFFYGTRLKGYSPNKYPFMRLFFDTLSDQKNCINRLFKPIETIFGSIKCQIDESDILPFWKLLTMREKGTAEWTIFNCFPVNEDNKISTIKREYICSWQQIFSPKEKIDKIPKPKVLTLDIECYSPNHKKFPVGTSPECEIVMIQCSIHKTSNINTKKKWVFTLLDCNPIDDVEIKLRNNEEELLDDFCNLIIQEDPDILIGHNNIAFDIPYINDRFKIRRKSWPFISRILGYSPVMGKQRATGGGFKNSSGVDLLDIEGRIILDTLPIISLDYPLESYSLEFVSNHFLGRGKHDVSAEQMFIATEEYRNLKRGIGDKENVYDKTTKFIKYGIEDIDLVSDIYEKLNIWTKSIELANTTRIRVIETFTRGQQIRGYALIFDYCYKNNIVVHRDHFDKSSSIEGGFVFEPIRGIHKRVCCLDFKSLYPSIIIANNICYTTIVYEDDDIPDEDCNIIECIDNNVEYKLKFIKKKFKVGILPIILQGLIDERNRIKGELKKAIQNGDEFKQLLEDVRQWVVKIIANSIYGFLKSPTLPMVEAAMATTAWGRKYIQQASQWVKSTYGLTTVYGDTDSIMIDISSIPKEESFSFSVDMAKKVSEIFPDELVMEMEKVMMVIYVNKKHYIAVFLDKKGNFTVDKNGEPIILVRGIPLSRRDKAKILKNIYKHIVVYILQETDKGTPRSLIMSYITNYIINFCDQIYNGDIDFQDFGIIKKIGNEYKDPKFYLNVFAQKLRSEGKNINPGDRIKFVVVENEDKKAKVSDKMMLIEDFNPEINKLDKQYYIEKVLSKGLDKLYYACFGPEISRSNFRVKWGKMRNYMELDKLVLSISKAIHYNEWNAEEFRKQLLSNPIFKPKYRITIKN